MKAIVLLTVGITVQVQDVVVALNELVLKSMRTEIYQGA